MLAKKTSKNQLTLPKDVARKFPDIEYFDVTVKNRKIILMPVKITPAEQTLEAIRDKMEKLGIQKKDIAEAIQWARKRKR